MSAIDFMIGGVQKAGTTALANYLAECPDIAMAKGKEAHVFDAANFDDAASRAWAERAFEPFFDGQGGGRLRGDATPITILHPRFIDRAVACNADLKWIVILRDPVARAISHYEMEKRRGVEHRGMLAAFLLEGWRLRDHLDDFSLDSPLRWATYARRGQYGEQLGALSARVPDRQIHVVDSRRLRADPASVVGEVRAFLGLPALPLRTEWRPHFEGGYVPPPAWSPARLYLNWRLRAARRDFHRRFGAVAPAPTMSGTGVSTP